jgi:hypothetical protein
MVKHCQVGVTTVRSRDAELAAVDASDSVLDVELDQASFRHVEIAGAGFSRRRKTA